MANVTSLCLLLLLVGLVSVTSLPSHTINSMADLQNREFGSKYPRHGLYLLYWFCHEYISFAFDNDDEMIPVRDPKDGAYGIHHYRNWENLLPSLSDQQNYAYYTVGNLMDNVNSPDNEKFPNYVLENFYASKNSNVRHQNNRDRIIVRRTPSGHIDQVYITQHYEHETGISAYDPDNTFRISSKLIKDICNLSKYWYFLNFSKRNRYN